MDDMLAQVKNMMAALVKSEVSPEFAADWAMRRIRDESVDWARDPRIWRALDRLGGADLQTAPGVYLHGKADFQTWLADLDAPPAVEGN